jgi:hypothetical protein
LRVVETPKVLVAFEIREPRNRDPHGLHDFIGILWNKWDALRDKEHKVGSRPKTKFVIGLDIAEVNTGFLSEFTKRCFNGKFSVITMTLRKGPYFSFATLDNNSLMKGVHQDSPVDMTIYTMGSWNVCLKSSWKRHLAGRLVLL